MKQLFRDRAFVVLWLSQAASGLGSTFGVFVLSWLVYEMTGSKLAMGSFWLSFMIPSLIVQILAGPYLDRWDRRWVMIYSEWFRAGGFLLPLILLPFGWLEVWHLYIVGIVIGIAQPLFRPASLAYTAQILPKDKLMKGNSVLEGTGQIMMLIGPALGGVLVTVFGVEIVLVVLIAALSLSGVLLLSNPSFTQTQMNRKDSWFKQFKEGFRFFHSYPVLFWVGMMMMLINFSSGAAQPMFLPYVSDILGGSAIQYGFFTSAFSFGMVFGTLMTGMLKEPKNRKAVMLGSLFCYGMLLILLGSTSVYFAAILFTCGMGLLAMVFNINNTTLYQQRVPAEIMGRVMSVRIFLAQAGVPFGAALGGLLAEIYSIPVLFSLLGIMVAGTTVVCWFSPVFSKLNDNAVESEVEIEKSLSVR